MSISKFNRLSLLFSAESKISLLATGIIVCNPAITQAQIIPDRTLPNNSTVTTNNNIVEINGGTVAGTNLFHSFTEFSINPDGLSNGINTAYFNNASNITNILSRVTGNSISEINGLIKNNGSADLFLINPNGIIFGEDAALDLGGSFISSTADSIQFAEGKEFSAVNPQANPLLAVNIPIGLQYGEQPGDIRVEGAGNELTLNTDNHTIERHNRPSGLAVLADETLALIGGDIFLEGGNLTAPAGNIELGSVEDNQAVQLHPNVAGWALDYTAADSFGKIGLSQAASVEVSGDGGGKVQLRGDEVSITEGSAILNDTWGDDGEGLLSINARDVEIAGTNLDLGFSSSLSANVNTNATGNGSNIFIEGNSLSVMDGGQIYLNNYGEGDAGNLTIDAAEIELAGIGSGLFSVVREDAEGNGANVNLYTDRLVIKDEAQITLDTFGLGNGGNLDIDAQEINLINHSGIFAHALTDIGNGGDIAIAAETFSLQNGAEIYAGNFLRTTVEDSNSNLLNTLQVSSSSLDYTTIGTGEAGNIDINASSIVLDSAGGEVSNISTATYLQGGGIIKLNAEEISINNSEVFTETKGNSHGGSVYFNTDTLHLSEGGRIMTSTFATGDAGKIVVKANDEVIATGENSGIFSQGDRNASGDAGNIEITGNMINFHPSSAIESQNYGLGKDGAISIEADWLNLTKNTEILEVDRKHTQIGNIRAARFRANNSQLLNMMELLQTINNLTELTVSTCTPNYSHNLALGQFKPGQLPPKKVASQTLKRIYQSESMAGNSVVEAKTWVINSQGKVELLANACN